MYHYHYPWLSRSDMDSDSDSDSDEDEDEKGSGEQILQLSVLLIRIFMVDLLMVAIVHDIDYQYDGSCIHNFIILIIILVLIWEKLVKSLTSMIIIC
jgi:hypothetical protein